MNVIFTRVNSILSSLLLWNESHSSLFMDDIRPLLFCVPHPLAASHPGSKVWEMGHMARAHQRYVYSFVLLHLMLTCSTFTELGWYGEMPGYYNTTTQPMVQYPQYGYAAPYGYPGNGIVQQPGQSIVIQPSANGGPPTVTQMPVWLWIFDQWRATFAFYLLLLDSIEYEITSLLWIDSGIEFWSSGVWGIPVVMIRVVDASRFAHVADVPRVLAW